MSHLAAELSRLRAAHLYRTPRLIQGPQGPRPLIDGRRMLAFCSNDYLGLANHPQVIAALKRGADTYGDLSTVTVHVRHGATTTSVAGALVGERPRVVQINGYQVDVPAEGHLIVLTNRDVPGVIGRVGTVLGEAGANIGAYHQSRLPAVPEALAAIAVDQAPAPDVLRRLAELPDVLEVRLVELNGER